MPMLDKRPDDGRFMGLFVGRSGSGKKVAAASFPGPIKYLDFDGRVGGIKGAKWIDQSKVDYTYYPPMVTGVVGGLMQAVNRDLETLMVMTRADPNKFTTCILGSLTGETTGLIIDATGINKAAGKGKTMGTINMAGPEEYGYEATGTYAIMAFMRSLPVRNMIVTAHVVDRYGKPMTAQGKVDNYAESVVIGQKLSLRDKIGENVPSYFDHIFEFEKREVGDGVKYFVRFRSSLARTSFAFLPDGWVDITGKDFYQYLQEEIMKNKEKAA